MKKAAIILLAICSFSCSKESGSTNNGTSTSQTEPVAYFKYKINGALIEMNGSLSNNSREGSVIRKTQQTRNLSSSQYLNNSNYIFKLMATKNYFFGDDGEPIIDIRLNTNTLSTNTFSRANNGIDLVRTFYPFQAVTEANWDFTVTISNIENGYASGVFSGKLNSWPTTYYNVTEGEFKNVKILQ